MAIQNRVLPIPLASLNASTLSGTYQAINSDGLPQPCFLVRIINDSDQDVTISFDGSTDHDYLRSTETLQFPAQSNMVAYNGITQFSVGSRIYVKGSSGSGFIYLAGYYQERK